MCILQAIGNLLHLKCALQDKGQLKIAIFKVLKTAFLQISVLRKNERKHSV